MSDPLFRLIYRSHDLVPEPQRATALGELFTTARRNNKRLDITGALMVQGDAFVQALEGDEGAVRALYATISADERHDSVTVLEERAIPARTFGRWAMAEVSDAGRPDLRLVSNARAGVIVGAGQDPSISPEQEEVLATMRASLAAQGAER